MINDQDDLVGHWDSVIGHSKNVLFFRIDFCSMTRNPSY